MKTLRAVGWFFLSFLTWALAMIGLGALIRVCSEFFMLGWRLVGGVVPW